MTTPQKNEFLLEYRPNMEMIGQFPKHAWTPQFIDNLSIVLAPQRPMWDIEKMRNRIIEVDINMIMALIRYNSKLVEYIIERVGNKMFLLTTIIQFLLKSQYSNEQKAIYIQNMYYRMVPKHITVDEWKENNGYMQNPEYENIVCHLEHIMS